MCIYLIIYSFLMFFMLFLSPSSQLLPCEVPRKQVDLVDHCFTIMYVLYGSLFFDSKSNIVPF